jgi:hypothetical protein
VDNDNGGSRECRAVPECREPSGTGQVQVQNGVIVVVVAVNLLADCLVPSFLSFTFREQTLLDRLAQVIRRTDRDERSCL